MTDWEAVRNATRTIRIIEDMRNQNCAKIREFHNKNKECNAAIRQWKTERSRLIREGLEK